MKRRRKLRVDLEKLLAELGVDAHRSGNEWRGHCPEPHHQAVFGSSAATKQGPGTWQINAEGFHHCYSCKWGGGPITLVAAVLEITGKEAYRWLKGFRGTESLPDRTEAWFQRKLPEEPMLRYPTGTRALWRDVPQELEDAVAYLLGRGLTMAEIERWRIGGVPEHERRYGGRVIVPIVIDGRMVDFVARLFVDRPSHISKALSGRRDAGAMKEYSLWGYDELDPSLDTVHVVEGVWGGVACLHAGLLNVTASCGSTWSEERTALLEPWDRIVMIPDGDAAGSQMVARASSLRFGHEVLEVDLADVVQPDRAEPGHLLALVKGAVPAQFVHLQEAHIAGWTEKF